MPVHGDSQRSRAPRRASTQRLAVALTLATLAACVGVRYQRAGERITPRAGQTLVVGRVRFVHDGREFFPWQPTLFPAANTERHVWLLRLGSRAVSAELRPDGDGSLAIWLADGDYALVGSTQPIEPPAAGLGVIALFRVPAGAVVAYAGELTLTTESREGGHFSSAFGVASVAAHPVDQGRAAIERKFGALPAPPVVSAWCAGEALPAFDDPKLAARGKALLDSDCRPVATP